MEHAARHGYLKVVQWLYEYKGEMDDYEYVIIGAKANGHLLANEVCNEHL